MAALRKANSYSKIKTVPYTRKSKVRSKNFIKSVPPQKVVKFEMGNIRPEKLKHHLFLVAKEYCQLRHNAIESCRQYLNKQLNEELSGNFFLKIMVYPHHIQRENKMLTGAGADRMQTGMKLSYGKPTGAAALVKEGRSIFQIGVQDEKGIRFARKFLNQIRPKLPCTTRISYEQRVI